MKFLFLELELRKVPNDHEIMKQSFTKISPMFPAWHCPVLLGFASHVPPVFGRHSVACEASCGREAVAPARLAEWAGKMWKNVSHWRNTFW